MYTTIVYSVIRPDTYNEVASHNTYTTYIINPVIVEKINIHDISKARHVYPNTHPYVWYYEYKLVRKRIKIYMYFRSTLIIFFSVLVLHCCNVCMITVSHVDASTGYKFRKVLIKSRKSGKSGNFRKIREFRKIPEKISGISGKTFFGNFRNCKKFGQFFGKFHCFYKNRSAQQCTHNKN